MTRTHHLSDTQNYCNEFVQIFLTQMYFILCHSTKNSQLKMRPMRWAFELSIETLNLTILYLWCNREILTITNICWYNTILVFPNIELCFCGLIPTIFQSPINPELSKTSHLTIEWREVLKVSDTIVLIEISVLCLLAQKCSLVARRSGSNHFKFVWIKSFD